MGAMSGNQPVSAAPLPGNGRYANAARNFADRAARRLPGFLWLSVAALAAAVTMIVVGGFGTSSLPLPTRIAFWLVLLGWSAIKWQAWFALLVRKPEDWRRAALLGSLLLNLPLPLEIDLALRLVGVEASVPSGHVWLAALAMSAVLYVILALVRHTLRPTPVPAEAPAYAIATDGLLARAGIRAPEALLAIVSEDHYCRVHLADGASRLIYFRFRDALAEVAPLDGNQVHRGAWAADHAVAAARRVGRRWTVELSSGALLPVSAQYVAELRRRGWHRRNGAAPKAA